MGNEHEVNALEENSFQEPAEKKDQRISEESATKSVDEILDFYRIKFKHIVNDQGKEGAETWKNKMVEAFRDGLLETKQDPDPEKGFQIIQHTSTGQTVIYNEYGVKAAREYAKQRDSASANLAMMASMSGKGMPFFESRKNFSGSDIRLLEALGMVFLF
jgi:hypothetical protein